VSPQISVDAYALWIVGLVVLGATLVQAARAASAPKLRFPQLTGHHLSTVLAWLIIAASALVVLARQK
jgi:hypothetical protein